jgi:hypothetical protein
VSRAEIPGRSPSQTSETSGARQSYVRHLLSNGDVDGVMHVTAGWYQSDTATDQVKWSLVRADVAYADDFGRRLYTKRAAEALRSRDAARPHVEGHHGEQLVRRHPRRHDRSSFVS